MFLTVALVTALAATPSPMEVVRSGNAQVQQRATAPGASVQGLASTVERFVDFGELARRALGKTWSTLDAAQRRDFVETMRGLLRASYAEKAIGQGTADVQYGKQRIQGNEAVVTTTVRVKKEEVPVDYKLFRTGAKPWRIYDVVTDEVSLLETYQGQFRRLLAEKGFDGLLATLKAKRAELEKSASRSPPQ